MPVLQIKNLSAGYKDKLLFKNVSFSLSKPKFVAVVGHNGSGKSTFLKTLSQKLPFHGQILLEGQNVSRITHKALSKSIAYLEQKNFISFSIPVLELVVMGKFRYKKLFESYNDSDYNEAFAALNDLGIEKLANRTFTELSGGEQQLVWIAQLILQDTSIWLLDEPTQMLDLYNKKKVFKMLKKVVKEGAKTVICVTHDLHALSDFEGHYLLNFSKQSPDLEIINEATIEKTIRYLEHNQDQDLVQE